MLTRTGIAKQRASWAILTPGLLMSSRTRSKMVGGFSSPPKDAPRVIRIRVYQISFRAN